MRYLFPAAFIYFTLLLLWNFEIGLQSNGGVLALALKKVYNDLYVNDFYVQHFQKMPIHERSFFLWLALPAALIPFVNWIFHITTALLLFIGWIKIYECYLKNFQQSILGVFIAFVPLYMIHWGGNELYYNNFQASLVAKATGTWVWYFLITQQYSKALPLLIFATWVHPMVGLQLTLLTLPFWFRAPNKLRYALLYGLFAGTYVGALVLLFGSQVPKQAQALLFIFRHSGHFIPHCFSKKAALLFPALISSVLLWSYKKERALFYSFSILATGILLYVLFYYGFHSWALMKSQWFRATVWVKPWGILALMQLLPLPKLSFRIQRWIAAATLILFVVFIWRIFSGAIYLFPALQSPPPAIEVALAARKHLPTDACVAHPLVHYEFFKYWSRRSCYLDWYHLVRSPEAITLWAQRLKKVYNIDYKELLQQYTCLRFKIIQETSEKALVENALKHPERLKQEGITHVLISTKYTLPYPLVFKNAVYQLYALP